MPPKPRARARAPLHPKLSRPRLFGALARPRLFERLDALRRHPVVWITGQPGAGKTTLAATWVEQRRIPGVWYQADAADADPATFFFHLREASRQWGGRTKGLPDPPLLSAEHLGDLAAFGRLFFRALAQRLRSGGVLVIDNYQRVPEASALHEALAAAAEEFPPGFGVLVLSWAEPPAAFARMRLNGHVAELRWDELRLTQDEAAGLAGALGHTDAASVRRSYELTDGWAAGLRLALEHEAVQDRREHGVVLFDYFASQVFAHLPAAQQEVLLAAALLEEPSPALVQALADDPAAERWLADMHRRHLFTDRLSDAPLRYRFHTLFRAFLLQQLQRRCAPGELAALKLRAAELLEGAGEHEPAFALYLDAAATEQAAGAALAMAPALLAQGRWPTLLAACEQLPAQAAAARPWLLHWWGMALVNRDFGAARERLAQAFRAFRDQGDTAAAATAAAAILHSHYFEFTDFAPMDPWLEEIDALLENPHAWPNASAELFVYSAVLQTCVFRQPGHRLLPHATFRVGALLDHEPDANRRLAAGLALLNFYTLSQDIPRARVVKERLAPAAADPSLTQLNLTYWYLFVAYHHHVASDRVEGYAAIAKARETADAAGFGAPGFLARIFEVYIRMNWGDYAEAAVTLRDAERRLDPAIPMQSAQYHLAAACLQLCLGANDAAEFHARGATAAIERVASPMLDVEWRLNCTVVLARNGHAQEALDQLDAAERMCHGTYLVCFLPCVHAARYFAYDALGDLVAARDALRQSLQLARAQGTFWYLKCVFSASFLPAALEAGIEPDFARYLIERFDLFPEQPWVENWPWRLRLRALGGFEVDIDGRPARFGPKVPRKALGLAKVMLAFGAQDVPDHRPLDALWPDEEADAAANALSVALYRLRKLLADPECIAVRDGRLSLDPLHCWSDVGAFEHYAEQARTAADSPERFSEHAARAVALYRGEFLAGEPDAPWAVPMRERLRAKFIHLVRQWGGLLEAQGQYAAAADTYLRGLEADALAESFYQGLIRCHQARGERAEALSVYRRMRQTLSVVLGINPGPESEALYRALTAN